MALVCDVVKYLNSLFPEETAEGFDNVGLLIGSDKNEVKKIMVMLDADDETVKEAINAGVQMIVTHHPFIFSAIKRINDPLILSLIENKIALYSAHTNLDSGISGVNDTLGKIFELSDAKRVVMPDCTLTGVIGNTHCSTLGELIIHIKNKLSVDNVRYTGSLDAPVSKIGVIGGSAAEFMEEMKRLGCDTFVTADVKYHQAQQAQHIGINIIDAGHFETENPICAVVSGLLKNNFSDIEILLSERKNSYIKYG